MIHRFIPGPVGVRDLLDEPFSRQVYADWLEDGCLTTEWGVQFWRNTARVRFTPWTVRELPLRLRTANGRRGERILDLASAFHVAMWAMKEPSQFALMDGGFARGLNRRRLITTVILGVYCRDLGQVAVDAGKAFSRQHGVYSCDAWPELNSGNVGFPTNYGYPGWFNRRRT